MRRLAALLMLLLLPASPAPASAPPPGEPPLAVAAREALAASLLEQSGVPGAEAFVSGVRFQDPARAAGGGEVVRVSFEGAARSGRGIPFSLFVRAASGEVRELRASADVSIQVPVVVAARSLPTGAVLGSDDVSVRRRDFSASGDAFFHDPSEVVGKRVRWQLSGGVPVRREYVEDPQALRRGDPVLIEAETGAVRITGRGVALQAGRIGERVLVRSQLSGKEMAGRLDAGHVVRVD